MMLGPCLSFPVGHTRPQSAAVGRGMMLGRAFPSQSDTRVPKVLPRTRVCKWLHKPRAPYLVFPSGTVPRDSNGCFLNVCLLVLRHCRSTAVAQPHVAASVHAHHTKAMRMATCTFCTRGQSHQPTRGPPAMQRLHQLTWGPPAM